MGSVVFVITLVALFGVIMLLASTRAASGLRGSLARARADESTNAEATRRTSAFQLRVQVAQNPFKSTRPR
jgi:hypothetical protein